MDEIKIYAVTLMGVLEEGNVIIKQNHIIDILYLLN